MPRIAAVVTISLLFGCARDLTEINTAPCPVVPAPAAFTATARAAPVGIELAWEAPLSDSDEPLVDGYVIERNELDAAWLLFRDDFEGAEQETTDDGAGVVYDSSYAYRIRSRIGTCSSDWVTVELLSASFPPEFDEQSVVQNGNELSFSWQIEGTRFLSAYRLERTNSFDIDSEGLPVVVTHDLSAEATFFLDDTLQDDREYRYTLFALNEEAFGTPAVLAHWTQPKALSSLTAVLIDTTIEVNWTEDNFFETGFSLTVNDGIPIDLPDVVTDYLVEDATLDTSYTFALTMFHPGGDLTDEVTVATRPNPTTATATAVSSTEIEVAWVDASNAESGYVLEYRMVGAPAFLPVTGSPLPATTLSFVVDSLLADSQYEFRVAPTNSGGTATFDSVLRWTLCEAPTAMTATGVSPVDVDLTWADPNANEVEIQLFRREAAGAYAVTPTSTLPADTTEIQDTLPGLYSAVANTQVFYQAFAVNPDGVLSAPSAEVDATTLGLQPANLEFTASPTDIDLTFTDYNTSEPGFEIDRFDCPPGSTRFTCIPGMKPWDYNAMLGEVTAAAPSDVVHDDPTVLTPLRLFFYEVSVSGSPSLSVGAFVWTPPSPVSNESANVVDTDSIILGWDASIETGVTGYRVEAKRDPEDLDYATIANVTNPAGTGITLDGLDDGTEYDFRIYVTSVGVDSAPVLIDDVVTHRSPVLSWVGGPTVGPSCTVRADGLALFDNTYPASYSSATGSLDGATAAATADQLGLDVTLDAPYLGPSTLVWEVTDSRGYTSSIAREMHLRVDPDDANGSYISAPVLPAIEVGRGLAAAGNQPKFDIEVDTGGDCFACASEHASVGSYNGHSCVKNTSGGIDCWGLGVALGNNDDTDSPNPVAVCKINTCTTKLTDMRAVSVGHDHACSLKDDGTLRCWGSNTYGQLGTCDTGVDRLRPATPQSISCSTDASGVVAISAGEYYTCYIRYASGAGQVRCFGRNNKGQLGDGTLIDAEAPHAVCTSGAVSDTTNCAGGSQLSDIRYVSAGVATTCAVNTSGNVWCWGNNNSGQAGQQGSPYILPQQVPGVSAAVAVAVGDSHTCALLDTGEVECWGFNNFGQIGQGTSGSSVLSPRGVCDSGSGTGCPKLTNVTSISAGDHHTCALLNSGAVRCWGRNSAGQVGNLGDSATLPAWVECADVDPLHCDGTGYLAGAVAIGSGKSNACAVMRDNAVMCWGNNSTGGQGNGLVGSGKHPAARVCRSGSGPTCDDGTAEPGFYRDASLRGCGDIELLPLQ